MPASTARRLGGWRGVRDPWIVAGVGVGLGVRVAMLVARLGDKIPFADTLWYNAQAIALRRGRGFNDLFTREPTAEHGPLTPILLSPGATADAQRALMALYGFAGFLVLVAVAWRLLPRTAARLAVFIAALYPNLWMHESVHMSEALAIGLVSTTMLCLVVAREQPAWWASASVGIAIGLAALARSELILLAPLCAYVIWRHLTRRAWLGAIALAAAATVVAPWVLYNLSRFEEPTFLTTNDGTTWLGANCDETWTGGDTGSWSFLCVVNIDELEEVGDASARSSRQRDLAFEYIGDHPRRLPVVLVARVARTLDLYGLTDMVSGDVGEDKFEWVAWLGIVSFWLLAPLAVVGLSSMRPSDRAVLWPVMVVVAVTTLLFYGAHRIRAPLEPAVVLASAAGISVLVDRWRASRQRPAGAGPGPST